MYLPAGVFFPVVFGCIRQRLMSVAAQDAVSPPLLRFVSSFGVTSVWPCVPCSLAQCRRTQLSPFLSALQHLSLPLLLLSLAARHWACCSLSAWPPQEDNLRCPRAAGGRRSEAAFQLHKPLVVFGVMIPTFSRLRSPWDG